MVTNMGNLKSVHEHSFCRNLLSLCFQGKGKFERATQAAISGNHADKLSAFCWNGFHFAGGNSSGALSRFGADNLPGFETFYWVIRARPSLATLHVSLSPGCPWAISPRH